MMTYIRLIFIFFIIFAFASCDSGNETSMPDGDDESTKEEEPETDGDIDGEMDGDIDSDEESGLEQDSGENEKDEEDQDTSIFSNPHDGRLYAAAGSVIITPTKENHPCKWLMGGTATDREADGIHDDLEVGILVLEQDGVHAVIGSMDLVGLSISDVDMVWDALEPHGVNRDHVILSSTHTHAGPDTIGVWGPNLSTSGRCPEYAEFIAESVVGLVLELIPTMVAVNVVAAEGVIDEPLVDHPLLLKDTRFPYITNDHFTVARMDTDQGDTVATVVNWHSHPEQLISSSEYSADFPRWTRKKLKQHYGGECIYLTGTVGGLATSLGVQVPERTEQGEPVLEGEQPVLISSDNEVKAWSLGYVIGEYAIKTLGGAQAMEGSLTIDTERIEIPFENLIFVLAIQAGVIPGYDEMITDDKDKCGFYGCMPQSLHHLKIGKLHLVTNPGELCAESSVGREASSRDWGEEWGEKQYPAIVGYRDRLPEGHLLMEVGLANNEIGYILPRNDFHPSEHPNYYEEYFSLGEATEELVREAISEMLDRSAR